MYRFVIHVFVFSVLFAISAPGQFVIFISPRAGLVSHTEGHVRPAAAAAGEDSVHLGEGERLTTGEGRAEITLGAHSVLRLDQHSQVELVSDDITDVQVRLLSGSVIFDVAKAPGEYSIALLVENARIRLMKRGVYRADAAEGMAPALRVLQGKTHVSFHGTEREVGPGHSIRLLAGLPTTLLSGFQGDMFDAWNRERARSLNKVKRLGRKLARAERGWFF